MRQFFLVAILFVIVIFLFLFGTNTCNNKVKGSSFSVSDFGNDSVLEFRAGDILVRPNWGWLPGSCTVPDGRKYGHVAIVIEGAKGNTIDEALEKSVVIEALFFDQATRQFQFRKEDQIRKTKATVSFGEKFKGIRYLLRTELNDEQIEEIKTFLTSQLHGGYDLFSTKIEPDSGNSDELEKLRQSASNWHCASLVWEAFYLSTGFDIDANGGIFIYPSDIIASKLFDHPGGRKRF
ncbi:MAG: hypothetical protein A2W90_01180 [Bacteroidetes bacterium GWF2_42_66]|nr:MAG: hypothetical protein A2W92_00600 [Bacteroidetes bacterium GWA2_42_15]OFY00992.1 MAG: hypothetical protein A2W89_14670 [Bacteroidetes bacterium GWE2_42_39]OFY41832.1 MAG: hypothetical protein A2W90_01180 [Bacteroidetes bacterium GWF2_42_66]HBL77996.1 hypothetical protein [Prolixibacteraceae bacterium]HCR90241.1 hypothetical protein [Prolixibacteraceae bacterium]